MEQEKVTIAIADDHTIFRQGLAFIISKIKNFEVIIEAQDGMDLLQKLEDSPEKPDVILMDLKMPKLDGMETTAKVKDYYPEIKVIILTMMQQEDFILHMFDLGVNGYLVKNTSATELKEAIISVVDKDHYFNDHVSEIMLKGLKRKRVQKPSLSNKVQLTPREQEVLELICQEYTTTEIADKIFVSHRTVETYRKNLLEKIEAKNTAGLIVRSIKTGIISLEE